MKCSGLISAKGGAASGVRQGAKKGFLSVIGWYCWDRGKTRLI
jgi:hypothetical protein